ncbi:transglutaminase family protein [Nocardioides sp. KR10-350]|uniref:transglutaminase family protein n=1 Tax=Nocardioides cheoyonin TaxID=3156615 RepID=UPI0032B4FFD3
MSMQLRIVHTTGFAYDGKAVASYNQARLTPLTTREQIVVHHRLEVSPKPWVHEYRDYFGNQVTAFEIVEPHESMRVTATSTVQVSRPPTAPPTMTWEKVTTPEVADRWTEYLMLPPLVSPPEDLAVAVKDVAASSTLPGEAVLAVSALVNREVALTPGATQAGSPASEAWAQRAGAGQDVVHLALGGLRTVGIPVRYVSGYVHPSPEPAVGEAHVGGSHAWLEFWDDGWHPYDPINLTEPGDTYVAVATGRDYTDVKPLSGIYSGAATSTMTVEVEVTRLA